FWVKCYAVNTETQDVTRIDAKAINGMSGNYADIQFKWNTTNLLVNDDKFDIYIEVDTAFQIDEIDEGNNLSSKELNLYYYKEGYPVTHDVVGNSRPLNFNFDIASASSEIVYGGNMYEADASLIISNNYTSSGAVAVSNLYNDDYYQYLFMKSTENSKKVIAVQPPNYNPLWDYTVSLGANELAGPIISDLDQDGLEEVIFFEKTTPGYNQVCLNNDGSFRWYDQEVKLRNFRLCNLENGYNHIIATGQTTETSKIYSLKENLTQTGLDDVVLFSYSSGTKIYNEEIADIDKDGKLEMIVIYSNNNSLYLMKYNLTDQTYIEISLTNISTSNELMISDINNDGFIEIIIADSFNEALSIYDKNLGLIVTIPVTGLQRSELSSADFNNDGLNDIVCMTKENELDYYIEIYDYLGNQIFKKPILDKVISIWIDDIDNDNENDIIYSCGRNLYAMSVAGAGTSIGCPGFGANHRRTGVLEQPAYFTIANDTVYWSNTISLTGDHILPYGSTVVIRPGTTIKAHQNSSLLVYGELIAEGLEHHTIEFRADINNAQAGYWQGITIKNHGIVTMENCIVRDAEIGVLFEDNNTAFFENNHMENNLEGIGAKTSSPVLKYNYVSGNTIGLGSYDNASPVMAGIIQLEQHKNGIINNPTGIFIDNASIYLKSGYNDIYSNPAGNDMYIQLNFEPKPGAIKVQNNYWGTTDLLQIKNHLSPSTAFTYSPACTQSNTGFTKNSDPLFELLGNAYSAMYSGNHTLADAYFKQLINDWPETNEAYLSVSGLFSNTKLAGQGWTGFEQYMGQLQQDTTVSEDFNKLLFSYTNLCLREQERYSEAVSNYESIVLNNPTYYDSVYAVIDIGNTYEEAGSYKTSLGQLSELIPVSSAKHTEKTVDLLLSLNKEQESISQNFESDYSIEAIFPNPFTNETSIKYQVADDCMVVFKVFDATGRLVLEKREYADANEEGLTRIGLGQSPPGVYYLVMECGMETRAVEKLVVK
ncbi:MAG: FG-GAP-like repeat-containing protein, partial [Bacteroidales bacterium]